MDMDKNFLENRGMRTGIVAACNWRHPKSDIGAYILESVRARSLATLNHKSRFAEPKTNCYKDCAYGYKQSYLVHR